jgi:hypothetical protein
MRRLSLPALPLTLAALPLLVACGACRPTVEPAVGEAAVGSLAEAETTGRVASGPCEGGVALDDGTFETGYGFVPSANWGIYLQRFDVAELSGAVVEEVCVCWLKTRGDQDADFEVLFWAESDMKLAAEPYAVVAGRAEEIPTSKETSGRLYPVRIEGVTLPEGPSWIGVRWNPSVENFLFVCADHGGGEDAEAPGVPVVFQEDRARGWADALTARDPIFHGHRAIGIRVKTAGPSRDG